MINPPYLHILLSKHYRNHYRSMYLENRFWLKKNAAYKFLISKFRFFDVDLLYFLFLFFFCSFSFFCYVRWGPWRWWFHQISLTTTPRRRTAWPSRGVPWSCVAKQLASPNPASSGNGRTAKTSPFAMTELVNVSIRPPKLTHPLLLQLPQIELQSHFDSC